MTSSNHHHRRSDFFLARVNIITRKESLSSIYYSGLEDLAARTCVLTRSDGKFQLPFLHLHLSESSFFPILYSVRYTLVNEECLRRLSTLLAPSTGQTLLLLYYVQRKRADWLDARVNTHIYREKRGRDKERVMKEPSKAIHSIYKYINEDYTV